MIYVLIITSLLSFLETQDSYFEQVYAQVKATSSEGMYAETKKLQLINTRIEESFPEYKVKSVLFAGEWGTGKDRHPLGIDNIIGVKVVKKDSQSVVHSFFITEDGVKDKTEVVSYISQRSTTDCDWKHELLTTIQESKSDWDIPLGKKKWIVPKQNCKP